MKKIICILLALVVFIIFLSACVDNKQSDPYEKKEVKMCLELMETEEYEEQYQEFPKVFDYDYFSRVCRENNLLSEEKINSEYAKVLIGYLFAILKTGREKDFVEEYKKVSWRFPDNQSKYMPLGKMVRLNEASTLEQIPYIIEAVKTDEVEIVDGKTAAIQIYILETQLYAYERLGDKEAMEKMEKQLDEAYELLREYGESASSNSEVK